MQNKNDHSAELAAVGNDTGRSETETARHGVDCELDECRECAVLGLIADWRRFGGEAGYALGYADARHDAARELELVLTGRDPYEQQEEATDQSAASTPSEGEATQSQGGESAQSPAPERSEDSRQALTLADTKVATEVSSTPAASPAPK